MIGLVLGGGLGVFVVGPRLDPHPPSVQAAHDAGAGGPGALGYGGDRAQSAAPGPVHVVDNLIVNPAGTRGRRFLVTTIVFEVSSADAVASMAQRDPEIRDALVGVLGAKTVDELSDTARRAALKETLRKVVEDSLEIDVSRLYVPQFVIQ